MWFGWGLGGRREGDRVGNIRGIGSLCFLARNYDTFLKSITFLVGKRAIKSNHYRVLHSNYFSNYLLNQF